MCTNGLNWMFLSEQYFSYTLHWISYIWNTLIISVWLFYRERRGLLQHEVGAPEAGRCLMSGCINKIEHFHPSCCWTGSFRPSYPAQGILLKQRHFQGGDPDITSVEINHDWILSSTNTHSMPLSFSHWPLWKRFRNCYFTTPHPLIVSSVQPLLIQKILMIA